MLRGPHTSFPIAGYSQRQGCVSHSTPEAELIALDSALRKLGVPGLLIWDTILPKAPALICHDDNQPMIRVLQTGKTQPSGTCTGRIGSLMYSVCTKRI